MTKEALIGEHNLNPLLTVHFDCQSLVGNNSAGHLYVINTHPRLHLRLTDIILILGYNYNI